MYILLRIIIISMLYIYVGIDIIKKVARDNVKLEFVSSKLELYIILVLWYYTSKLCSKLSYANFSFFQDFYHAQILDGNLCDFLSRNIKHIGKTIM